MRLLLLLLATTTAEILLGGSGWSAFLNTTSVLTSVSLPQNQSLSLAYWSKATVPTSIIWRTSSISTSALAFTFDSTPFKFSTNSLDSCDDRSEDCDSGWIHHAFAWDAATHAVAGYVNGAPVVFSARNSDKVVLNVVKTTSVKDACGTSKTLGGYVLDDEECVFPFTFKSKTYTTCAPWMDQPAIRNAAPRPGPFSLSTGAWCPTTNKYSMTDATKYSWGFCACKGLSRDTRTVVASEGNAIRAGFSGGMIPLLGSLNAAQVSGCNPTRPSNANGFKNVLVVVDSETCSVLDGGFRIAKLASDWGYKVVFFADSDFRKRILPVNKTATFNIPSKTVTRLGFRSMQRNGPSECPMDLNLFDGDLSTTWVGCEVMLEMKKESPYPTHYAMALVLPFLNIDGATATASWRVYGRRTLDSSTTWTLIDRRLIFLNRTLNTSVAAAVAAALPITRQRVFPLIGSVPTTTAVDGSTPTPSTFKQYKIVFDQCKSPIIAEINIVAIPSTVYAVELDRFADDVFVVKSSFEATRSSSSSNITVNAFVASIKRASPFLFALQTTVAGQTLETYFKFTPKEENFASNIQGVLTIGQINVGHSVNTFDRAAAFVGLLDDVRIFPFALNPNQAARLYQYTDDVDDSLALLNTPLTMYNFDKQTGEDSGYSKQDLMFGKTADVLDPYTFRFSDNPQTLIMANGPVYFVPSRLGRTLGGEIVIPITKSQIQKRVVLTGIDTENRAYWDVSIATLPKFGTLSNLTVLRKSSLAIASSAFALVDYTKSASSSSFSWTRDEFEYEIYSSLSAARYRGRVVLTFMEPPLPTPKELVFYVKPGQEVMFFIGGGAVSAFGDALKIILNTTALIKGKLVQALNCSSSSLLETPTKLIYQAPLIQPLHGGLLERITWWYKGGNDSATVTFIVASSRPISATVKSIQPPTTLLKDGQVFIITFDVANMTNSTNAGGGVAFELLHAPYFGSLYRYFGNLRPGAVSVNLVPLTSYATIPEAPMAASSMLVSEYVDKIVRSSSKFVSPAINYNEECVESCENFNDANCCISDAEALKNNDNYTSFDVSNLLGSPDGAGFRFSALENGHEFLEFQISKSLNVRTMTVRQKRSGAGTLFRISSATLKFTPNLETCGGSERSFDGDSFFGPWPNSNADCAAELHTPFPVSDCETSPEFWDLMWQTSCPSSMSSNTAVTDNNDDADDPWVETTIPICTLGNTVDTFRLEFDTRNSKHWTTIDSIVVHGYPLGVDSSTYRITKPTMSYVYFPPRGGGVVGIDMFTFRLQSTTCQVNTNETISGQIELDSTTYFDSLPAAFVGSEPVSDVKMVYSFVKALDMIALNIYNEPRGAQVVLWPFVAKAQATVKFLYFAPQTNLFSLNRLGITEFTFPKVNSSFFVDDPKVDVTLRVSGFSDTFPEQELIFRYSSSINGDCGVPPSNPALGPCSRNRAHLHPGTCERQPLGGYACNCYSALTKESDIVVAGPFCEYTSFTTCYGRGYPNDNGDCICFDKQNFGGRNCDKRSNFINNTIELFDELILTYDRFKISLAFLNSTSDFKIINDSQSVQLVSDFIWGITPLIYLNLTKERDPDNSCTGHGIPLESNPPLSLAQTECNCEEGYFPKKNCFSQTICDPGEYIVSSGVCQICPVNNFCEKGVSFQPCPNGTFTLAGQRRFTCFKDCAITGPNRYLIEMGLEGMECGACALGYACNGVKKLPCPPGTLGTKEFACLSCFEVGASDTYSDLYAQTNCKRCPDNTVRVSTGKAMDISECVCRAGFWNNLPANPQLTGVPCVHCPGNAKCVGHSVFKNQTEITVSSRRRRRILLDGGGNNGTAVATWNNSSPFPLPGYWGDENYPTQFFACQESGTFNPCEGGSRFGCATGYRGRFCLLCESGYHSVGGFCQACPAGADTDAPLNNAMVFFGIAGIILAFAILNRASAEVQALDIALMYTQVASLVQNFSFAWPFPVTLLQTPYAISNFDIDFINSDCITANRTWNYESKFYVQLFFVWYVGVLMLFTNLLAIGYSRFRERRKARREIKTEVVTVHAVRTTVGKQAAKKAQDRNEIRRAKTGEMDLVVEAEGVGSPKENSFKVKRISTAPADMGGQMSPARSGVLSSPLVNATSSTSDSSGTILKRCMDKLKTYFCQWGEQKTKAKQMFHTLGKDDAMDPRIKAIATWVRRTMGLPKNKEEYKSYTNGQLAGWLNLVRLVYNSVVVLCLNSYFCVTLADGTSVMQILPDTECGSLSQRVLLAFGILGFVLYGFGLPLFVYLLLTQASHRNMKADKVFFERFGFYYEGYRQRYYRWEIMVLARRLFMCMVLVCADNLPYIQAIVGGMVILVCLGAQLYHMPYLSDRINVLESIALASIFLYVMCGLVFTGLNDFFNSPSADANYLQLASQFTTALAWTLLIVSLLTLLICLLVFIQDLRDYFSILVTERSLLRHAESEDVGLIRVLRKSGTIPKQKPKIDLEAGRQVLDVISGKRARSAVKSIKRTQTRDSFKRDSTQETSRKFNLTNTRGSMTSMFGFKPTIAKKSLFSEIDEDGSNVLSKAELLKYVTQNLDMDSDESRAQVELLFEAYDVDESGSVDFREFLDMLRSNRPESKECELKDTIKPKYLIKWANSESITPLSVALFFELDNAMRSAVADDSIVSVYRDSSVAKFYRSVAEAFPFLGDWLAGAAQEDVDAFRRILTELNECRDHVGTRGTFTRLTVEIDRAPLIWWLVSADEKERRTFRTVFSSICRENGETRFPIWQRIKTGSAVYSIANVMKAREEHDLLMDAARVRDAAVTPPPRQHGASVTNDDEESSGTDDMHAVVVDTNRRGGLDDIDVIGRRLLQSHASSQMEDDYLGNIGPGGLNGAVVALPGQPQPARDFTKSPPNDLNLM